MTSATRLTSLTKRIHSCLGADRLRLDSPCIDSGTNLTKLLTTDILGLPRVMDGNNEGIARVDIGAYEFNPYRFNPALQMGEDGFQFNVRGEPGRSVRIEWPSGTVQELTNVAADQILQVTEPPRLSVGQTDRCPGPPAQMTLSSQG